MTYGHKMGTADTSGGRGRRFKSSHLDQQNQRAICFLLWRSRHCAERSLCLLRLANISLLCRSNPPRNRPFATSP